MTEIKRLKQHGEEFVPITLAEAVVVNTRYLNIPGVKTEITTLDKVLLALGLDISVLVNAIDGKKDDFTWGDGFTISEDNVVSITNNMELYKIVSLQDFRALTPSEDLINTIYVVPKQGEDLEVGNLFQEFICASREVNGSKVYFWELIGDVQASVDLSGYVTKNEFNRFVLEAITAEEIYTSSNQLVIALYDIPTTLYDNMIATNDKDFVEIPSATT